MRMAKYYYMPVALLCALSAPAAEHLSAVPDQANEAADTMMQEIIITATKKSEGERLQDVPVSITAFGAQQLQVMQYRNLESLTFSIPNVALDQIGTQKGLASFSIRGLGVNSSVPSVEPAVGTFVDGVYMGTNLGVVTDTFDVDSIEVLRGPQGVLFGRNVTGGAVVVTNSRPNGDFHVTAEATYENRDDQTYAGSVEGTLVQGKLFGKVSALFNDDGGYFKNVTTGRYDGQNKTYFVRPVLVFEPNDDLQFTLIAESGQVTGDGPVARNPKYASEFDTADNFPGSTDLSHKSLVFESDFHLPTGVITNILGYRTVQEYSYFDVDGSPQAVYELYYYFHQQQLSDELRWAGRLGRVDLSSGLYWFHQDMTFITEDDLLYLDLSPNYGGVQKETSLGAFVNGDITITDRLTLGLGERYTRDQKDADVASRVFTQPQPCNLFEEVCTSYNFFGSTTTGGFTPRIMLKYAFTPDINSYASFTKGFRSGGFNLKSSSVAASPGPFGDEVSDSYEIGVKSTFLGGKVRLNADVFYNYIRDLQRQTTQTTPVGFETVIGNAANARIQGAEMELSVVPAHGLVLRASVGVLDGRYTSVWGDLNGDGVVDAKDLALKLPRLAPLTYSVGSYYDTAVGGLGDMGYALTFDHRDASWFDDANTGRLPSFENLFASVSLSPQAAKQAKFSLYVKNILNSWNVGDNTPLGTLPSGGAVQFSTKGRVYGAKVSVHF